MLAPLFAASLRGRLRDCMCPDCAARCSVRGMKAVNFYCRASAALFAALLLPGAQGAVPGGIAVARTDANSLAAHAQLLQKAHAGHIDLYFLGDSITRRWGTSDAQYHEFYENWQRNFHGWNAADFGWGGDTTGNILWRLEQGELDGVNPRVIVLLAGTNDLGAALEHQGRPRDSEDEVVTGITALVRACRMRAPEATLILTSITPRIDHRELLPRIARINRRIARLADGQRIRYLDISAHMVVAGGDLNPGMVGKDGLHLALGGYQVWADALAPLLQSLLGPRGPTDLAPPPTGDPGLGPQ
jgi:lysophospholipase L1-like esterase